MREPHTETIEGQRTLVVERKPPLPQKLDGLLAAIPNPTYRDDIRPRGAAKSCERRDHRFKRFREGRSVGTDGVVRDLALQMCADCGAVIVRDVSYDSLPGAAPARPIRLTDLRTGETRVAPTRLRKSDVLGWYSGARRNRREYR